MNGLVDVKVIDLTIKVFINGFFMSYFLYWWGGIYELFILVVHNDFTVFGLRMRIKKEEIFDIFRDIVV